MKYTYEIGAKATINLDAFRHNFSLIKKLASKQKIVAMIKSNAYGHGALKVAEALKNDANAFGVACIKEAVLLRKNGITRDIIVMRGFANLYELQYILNYNLIPIIHDKTQLAILKNLKQRIKIWLKIDTGMSRLGFLPEEFPQIFHELSQNKFIEQPITVLTHLANSEDQKSPENLKQIETFFDCLQNFPCESSFANSGAIINYPEFVQKSSWVRPGLILYGVTPSLTKNSRELGLIHAMKLSSNLIAIKEIKKGSAVGYNGTYIAQNDMKIGIIAAGYGDGLLRIFGKNSFVIINNEKAPILGKVSMDLLTVDLTQIPHPQIGDEAIFWDNDHLEIESLDPTLVNPYERFCQLTDRVEYIYEENFSNSGASLR